ncbi:MAG: Asp-tRNA(Asn)/Glu-tRNA(Gln) amidotransferase GatCAB subunit C [Firmicutes bacterium HGW-Firmicutes-13]|nr:MAG: Asp-tRNA(Asn)/Glu-tRNA(Gln) amidotransferase GatCAB subunit C [Firmicutes bacterium HGW-Firmicutes-13]
MKRSEKMTISLQEIKDAAWDARLELNPREEETLLKEARQLFEKAKLFIDSITEEIPPTFYPVSISTIMREDKEQPSLPIKTALSNAPDADDYCFHVPRIIEE